MPIHLGSKHLNEDYPLRPVSILSGILSVNNFRKKRYAGERYEKKRKSNILVGNKDWAGKLARWIRDKQELRVTTNLLLSKNAMP